MVMESLEKWFLENKRNFPWRENKTPYRVWISEVMLQQTRASVVVDYFERWMEIFPTIEILSNSSIETVIKTWEGLGYYSRARNIHKASKIIVEKFQGIIPDDYDSLLKIPGFGPYTASAVLCFAFEKKAYPIDGNVNRVISRYAAIEIEISKRSFRKQVEDILSVFFNHPKPFVLAEGLIELGALICGKTPKCCDCPLKEGCAANKTNQQVFYPLKKQGKELIKLFRPCFVIEHEGSFLLKINNPGVIMADLAEFPFIDVNDEKISNTKLLKLANEFYQDDLELRQVLTRINHSFTQFKANVFPVFLRAKIKKEIAGFEWVSFGDLQKKAFSSGHKKILLEVAKIYS